MGAERDERPTPAWKIGDLACCISAPWGGVMQQCKIGSIFKVAGLKLHGEGVWLNFTNLNSYWFDGSCFAQAVPDIEPATEEFAGFLHAALADYRRAQQERRP